MTVKHVFNETQRLIKEYDLSRNDVKVLNSLMLQANTKNYLLLQKQETQVL